jgi:hypothetical protein
MAANETGVPEVHAVLLHKLRSRIVDSSRVTVPGTHPTTTVTARLGQGSAFAPDILLTFSHAPAGAEPQRVHFRMGKDGRLVECDADGLPKEGSTVRVTRSLIGPKTFLHLHGMPWRPMENHDVSAYVVLRALPALVDRTHTVQDLRAMEPEAGSAMRAILPQRVR